MTDGGFFFYSVGDLSYRYHDDTLVWTEPGEMPAADLLKFIARAQEMKRELEPDGYWKPPVAGDP